jgi:hypothetical protein
MSSAGCARHGIAACNRPALARNHLRRGSRRHRRHRHLDPRQLKPGHSMAREGSGDRARAGSGALLLFSRERAARTQRGDVACSATTAHGTVLSEALEHGACHGGCIASSIATRLTRNRRASRRSTLFEDQPAHGAAAALGPLRLARGGRRDGRRARRCTRAGGAAAGRLPVARSGRSCR